MRVSASLGKSYTRLLTRLIRSHARHLSFRRCNYSACRLKQSRITSRVRSEYIGHLFQGGSFRSLRRNRRFLCFQFIRRRSRVAFYQIFTFTGYRFGANYEPDVSLLMNYRRHVFRETVPEINFHLSICRRLTSSRISLQSCVWKYVIIRVVDHRIKE